MKIGDVFMSRIAEGVYSVMRCIDDGKLSNCLPKCIIVYTGSKAKCENIVEKCK